MESGRLFVVATPLGNLDDLTPRGRKTLSQVAAVACEDTRHTGKLLSLLGLSSELISYHAHNEASRSVELVERLTGGDDIALVSDAGTPAVSDPGARLVSLCADHGVQVIPVPGPSALTTLMSVSGFDHPETLFAGFLPSRRSERRRTLERLGDAPANLVLYESPHRIAESLADMADTLGENRRVVVGRELTKLHEEIVRGTLTEVEQEFSSRERVRGELCVIVEGYELEQTDDSDNPQVTALVDALNEEGLSSRSIRDVLVSVFNISRNDAYSLAMAGTSDRDS